MDHVATCRGIYAVSQKKTKHSTHVDDFVKY